MRPTRRLLYLLTAWLLLGVAVAFLPALVGLWWAAGGVLLVLLGGELLVLRRSPLPTLERRLPRSLVQGAEQSVRLRLSAHPEQRRPLRLSCFDHPPAHCEVQDLPQRFTLAPERWVELSYPLRPLQRGLRRFGRCSLRMLGPLGLLSRSQPVGEGQEIRVYPDIQPVAHFAALALSNRTWHIGIHQQRRRGQGTEFHQLREYRRGDALRQVDWKAVSRRRQLISREYREEQNQRLVFLLDCGHRMLTRDGELSHFDQVLRAMLLLSHVALKRGDSVGLMCFSGQDRWLPPKRGAAAMPQVLDAVFDLTPTDAPSDFGEAARRLLLRQRRRSLVVLLSNLRDDDELELPAALAPLRHRHLVLLASVRESALDDATQLPMEDLGDALTVGAAHRYLEQRRAARRSLETRGVRSLDTLPQQLPSALVNEYLAIKRAGLL